MDMRAVIAGASPRSSGAMSADGPRRRTLFMGLGLAISLGPLAGCAQPTATPPGPGMSPSVTYLHLLAKVPFFAALSREQLQWVIDHSREWAVAAGAEIASTSRGGDSFWVLLDGGWRVEQGERSVSVGHADPAKWYGGRDMLALGGSTRLVATARSYVMQISQAELDEMLRRGSAIGAQLDSGMAFYRSWIRR